MHIPAHTAVDDDAARALVAEVGSGWLVTNGADSPPDATLLPIIWREDRVICHLAKANPQWSDISDGDPGLVIVTGPQAFISPSWYPSRHEHGRVLPTWNYLAVHLSGPLHLHHEPDWLLEAVTDLTDLHEAERADRWRVDDAPEQFVSARLRGVVGVEMKVERVDAKAKVSREKSDADRAGVVAGLRAAGAGDDARRIADAVARADKAG